MTQDRGDSILGGFLAERHVGAGLKGCSGGTAAGQSTPRGGGTKAPAGMSKLCPMEWEETEGSPSQQGERPSGPVSDREPESEVCPAPVAIGVCPRLPPTASPAIWKLTDIHGV